MEQPREILLVPQAVEKLFFPSRQVDRNIKEMILKIKFYYGGRLYSKDVIVHRLTIEEWKRVRACL